jgi:hypothetical protein
MRLFPRNVEPTGVVDAIPSRPEVLRRYEITVEREFLGIWNDAASGCAAFCPACSRIVGLLPPEVAAKVMGTTARTIYRWVEEHRVHFVEPAQGQLLICCDSLQALTGSALETTGPDATQDGSETQENK